MKKETKDNCFLAKHEKANSLYGNLREFSGLFSNSPDSPQQKDQIESEHSSNISNNEGDIEKLNSIKANLSSLIPRIVACYSQTEKLSTDLLQSQDREDI